MGRARFHRERSGNAVVTSKPVPAPKRQPGETHVLASSIVEMKMRPGGKESKTSWCRAPESSGIPAESPRAASRTLPAMR
jgi:hypothetical protein